MATTGTSGHTSPPLVGQGTATVEQSTSTSTNASTVCYADNQEDAQTARLSRAASLDLPLVQGLAVPATSPESAYPPNQAAIRPAMAGATAATMSPQDAVYLSAAGQTRTSNHLNKLLTSSSAPSLPDGPDLTSMRESDDQIPKSDDGRSSVEMGGSVKIVLPFELPPEIGLGAEASVWPEYVNYATDYDKGLVDGWNDTTNIFLIFAALFSAVVTAFLALSYTNLQADNSQATVDALVTISLQLSALVPGTSAPPPPPFQPAPFTPSSLALWVNGFWFASLIISLCGAIVAMLVRGWVRMYTDGYDPRPLMHARQRQFRYIALLKWKVPPIINALPLIIHLAVFLFLLGLLLFLWDISVVLAVVIWTLLGIALVGYLTLTVLPILEPDCPYKSPSCVGIYLLFAWLGNYDKVYQYSRRLLLALFSVTYSCSSVVWNRFTSKLQSFIALRWSLRDCMRWLLSVPLLVWTAFRKVTFKIWAETGCLPSTMARLWHITVPTFKLHDPRAENEAMQDRIKVLEYEAVHLLLSCCLDPKVRAPLARGFIGYQTIESTFNAEERRIVREWHANVTPAEWSEEEESIPQWSSQIITSRLKSDDVLEMSTDALMQLASLSMHSYNYPLPDDKLSALEFMSGDNALQRALAACVLLLSSEPGYNSARGYGESVTKVILIAKDVLIRALESQEVPSYGCCLLLQSFSTQLYKFNVLPVGTDEKSALVSILSQFLASPSPIPAELLSSIFGFFQRLLPQMDTENASEKDMQMTWNNDPAVFVHSYLQIGDPLGVLNSLLLCICQNPHIFNTFNGRIINVLCTQLLSSRQAGGPMAGDAIIESAMRAVNELLAKRVGGTAQRRDPLVDFGFGAGLTWTPSDDLDPFAAIKFFTNTRDSPRSEAASEAYSLSLNKDSAPEIILHGDFQDLISRASEYRFENVLISVYTVWHALRSPRSQDIVERIIQAGWLDMMNRVGLWQLLHRVNHAELEIAEKNILLLWKSHRQTVNTSGILAKIQSLYSEYPLWADTGGPSRTANELLKHAGKGQQFEQQAEEIV